MSKQKNLISAASSDDSYEFIKQVSSIGALNTDSPYSSRKAKRRDTAQRIADRKIFESITKQIVEGLTRYEDAY